MLSNLQITYKLIKLLLTIKEELVEWARLSRENKLNQSQQNGMMNKAYEIDGLLKEIGIEWVNDYEQNKKIKASIGK